LREIYTAAIPAYTGSVTVPVLRVRVHRTIVNNESSEIIRMFNSAFDGVGAAPGDNYPSAYRGEIDALNAQINDTLLAIAEEIVAADQHTLDLVRSAHEVGAAPNTDVLQTAAQLDHDRALLPPYRQQLQVSEDVLAILVGRSPTDWSAPKFELSEFTLPANLPNTMPSVLARRRSDILAAEARLHTASAHIGVAEADLYPNLDLSAAVSRQGLLGGPSETAWSLIGGVAAPIFNGGRLIAAKRAAEANYKASFALYQDVVITALGQVADALNALANDADALAAQEDAFVSAKRSLALDQEGYKAGSADLTRVLDAQRLLDQSEDGVTRAESARLDDTVKLFFALGIGPPPDLDGARPTGRR
jgi:NodT family efflux transporter outer membrane factor (OMF) lipoprotein